MNPATNPVRPSSAARSLLSTIGPKDIPPPDGLQLDLVNWWRFVAAEVDALLAGEELAIWRVVSALWPTLRKPRFWCDGQHQRTADSIDASTTTCGPCICSFESLGPFSTPIRRRASGRQLH